MRRGRLRLRGLVEEHSLLGRSLRISVQLSSSSSRAVIMDTGVEQSSAVDGRTDR